jgi:predicted cobalt transporter CbtA
MRALLVRGLLAGAAAGLVYALFAFVAGEPALDAAITFEERAAAAEGGHEHGVELVGRGVQSTLGLGVAAILYGVAVGGIFALLYASVIGRIGRLSARATAAVLALVAFVVVSLVPFLKYPANPPASTLDETVGQRTLLYLVMLVCSIAAAIAAAALGRRLVARFGAWNGVLLAGVAYLVVVTVVGVVLPSVAETPADFPAPVLYDFRLAALGGQAVLWAVLGLGFGALAERGLRSDHDQRADVVSG